MRLPGNHYEKAFESWLIENRLRYISIDQSKRAAFSGAGLKSFDFLVWPGDSLPLLVEVKGRKCSAISLDKPSAMQY